MRFAPDVTQRQLIDEVDEIVRGNGTGAPPRDMIRRLGARRLLAVHWPEAFGGRGLSLAEHITVAERIGLHGLPDEAHLVTVQGVGCTVLTAGTDDQRRRWLPALAGGRSFASLLLSEPDAGSDLAALRTSATRDGDCYRLEGEKTWNLHADWSSVGLCSARTRLGADAYDGITMFLVDFDTPGVRVAPMTRSHGRPYFTVTFDGVRVAREKIVGKEHRGWPVLTRAIGFERIGVDYIARAQRWLVAARSTAAELPAESLRRGRIPERLLRHERAVAAARALVFRAAASADAYDMDEAAAACAKLAAGEAAQHVAWWADEAFAVQLADGGEDHHHVLRQAVAEAPELTISGGASELQLDIIAMAQRAQCIR